MLLTVIIVTKNPNDEILPTFSSLKSLDDKKVEILIKDNSSTRNLEKLNDVFEFSNFRYIHSEDDGVYDAMNQAIQLAKGEFVYFLNAGDQYLNCNLLSTLENSPDEIDFYYGNIIALKPFMRLIRYSRFLNKYSVYLTGICHQGIVFRKKVFEDLGLFDKNLKIHADYLLILHLVARFKGSSLNRYIALYKGGGISYGYQLTTYEKNYLKTQLKNIFSTTEIWLLQLTSYIVSSIVYLKNIRKPT